jgi:hypothetical protein
MALRSRSSPVEFHFGRRKGEPGRVAKHTVSLTLICVHISSPPFAPSGVADPVSNVNRENLIDNGWPASFTSRLAAQDEKYGVRTTSNFAQAKAATP